MNRKMEFYEDNCVLLHGSFGVAADLVHFEEIPSQEGRNASAAFVLGYVPEFMGNQLLVIRVILSDNNSVAEGQPAAFGGCQSDSLSGRPKIRFLGKGDLRHGQNSHSVKAFYARQAADLLLSCAEHAALRIMEDELLLLLCPLGCSGKHSVKEAGRDLCH
jgi:hypothetical protein